MVSYCDAVWVHIKWIHSKEATLLSLHGCWDVGKEAKRSHCTEKMKDTDSVWGSGQNGEERQRGEPSKKSQAVFPSFKGSTTGMVILFTLLGVTGRNHQHGEDWNGTNLKSPGWVSWPAVLQDPLLEFTGGISLWKFTRFYMLLYCLTPCQLNLLWNWYTVRKNQ